ncbi:class I adenylate-forming enzyme family protein [Paracandidimonas lactea]|uniref:class I adenylate-forming enzyme family protein n=1 Tax=Paracandidimonas lactea TaxID=2895524 RepID=UPI001F2D3579|nr:AMP-binding protein [Paracandidimonas lactea]
MSIDLPDPDFRIHQLVSRHVSHLAHQTALITDEGIWTYEALDNAVRAMADLLRDRGLRAGDRLLVIGESGTTQLAAIFACSLLDAWAVVVNARMTGMEVDTIKAHCQPRLSLATSGLSKDARDHGTRHGAREEQIAGLRFSCTDADPNVIAEPTHANSAEQVAVLIYTSGTTGTPKGVMLTHANLGHSSAVARNARGTKPSDRVYSALPVAHVYGLSTVALAALGAGATLQLTSRFDIAHAITALADGVTMLHGVPAMYLRLLQAHDQGTRIVAPQIRLLHCGGAPLDPSLKGRIEAIFGEPINNGYGLTEASPTVSAVPYRQRRDDLSVGYLIPGMQSRIVDKQGQTLPHGQIGELLVRGPNVMKGYYKAPQQTAEVLDENGWLRTGDLLCEAPDGALFVMGRIKDLIIRSGFNVYPSEVEAVINALPEVRQSCVVGVPQNGDEQIVAFIEAEEGVSIQTEALLDSVRQRLAPYKRPQRVVVLAQLPTASNGKILRKAVMDLALAEHTQNV